MKKDYFIGIVPPEEYMERIVNFQIKWMGAFKCRAAYNLESTRRINPG